VKLTGAGAESSAPLVVRLDPNTGGSEADVQAQAKVLTEIRDNVNGAAELINQAESIRAQLQNVKSFVTDGDADALKKDTDALDEKIVGVESHLFNMTATGRGQDYLRMPSQIVEKLMHLADVVSLGDFGPTKQALEVHAKLTQELAGYRDRFKQIVATDVAAFNRTLQQRGAGGIVSSGR
jgi:hypothetical protein